MTKIHSKFAIIEDWRNQSYVKHNLSDILILIMGAVISGITELAEMMEYFENKIDFFTEHFGITAYPSKPTISRFLSVIDGEKVGQIIIQIMVESVDELGDIISVDGKTMRSTVKKDKPNSALQILSAYAVERGIVIGQEAISNEDKTNEIPVFREMLEFMNIKGKTITGDAMHCQKETCAKIIAGGGDYVFGLKGNQSGTLEDVSLFFKDKINNNEIAKFHTIEQNGGRIEKRICAVSTALDGLHHAGEWAGLRSIIAVKRKFIVGEKTSEEINYYISSRDTTAEEFLKIIRAHWRIESVHWCLGVIWNEDDSGIISENGNKPINAFRKLALLAHKKYIAKQTKKRSIKGNVFASLLNDEVLLGVIRYL